MTKIFTDKPPIYNCINCDYKCFKKSEWEKHIQTVKHKNRENDDKNIQKSHICKNCGKNFSYRQSLFVHKKKCNSESNKNEEEKNIILNFSDKILNSENFIKIIEQNTALITQNQEFKDLLMEQNKIIMELTKNTGNNNNVINSHNKTFNLQVFLNEKCKDALNISDFVNSLKLTLEDLENVGENGFVNGITKIFVNGLKQLDVYKRPIHCSDLKRETMYLKNENVWEKDNENKENMKKVIKQIANKNIKKIYEWKDKYPDCKYSDSKKNDQYSRIIIESMGAKTIEEDQVLYEKIIKNIAKETIIDKTK